MIEVTIKTLDGKNRSFSVPDDITVKQFKEKIATSIEIAADVQRLIYCGRVLQDDKNLNEYDVNGKVIHVVQRPPPSARPAASSDGASTSTADPRQEASSYVLGSFTLPSDVMDPNQVQNIVQNVIGNMGDLGRNARVTTRSSSDGSSVDVHINLGQIAMPQVQSESQQRLNHARRMIQAANRTLNRLENPPSGSGSGENSPMETNQATDSPNDSPRDSPTHLDAMDTNSSTEGATAPAPSQAEAAPSGATGGAASNEQQNASNGQNGGSNRSSPTRGQNRGPRHPAPSALGELLTDVFALNDRLQPHMESFQRLMNEDPQLDNEEEQEAAVRNAQRLCNLVTETMHYISHAYHSISDLMVDMGRAPPRSLRAPPHAHPTAVIHQAIPMQAQINIGAPIPGQNGNQAQGQGQASPGGSTSDTATSTTTSQASSTGTRGGTSGINIPGLPPGVNITGLPPGIHIGGLPPGMNIPGMPQGVNIAGMPPGANIPGMPPGVNITGMPQGVNIPGMPQGVNITGMPQGVNITGMPPGINITGMPPGVNIPGMPPGGTPPGGSVPGMPAGVTGVASSNPYVFMEVGPHAVTINSISAHVVSADGTPISTSSTGTSTSSGTSTTSSSSSSTTTSSSQVPPTGLPQGIQINAGNIPAGGVHVAGPPGMLPPELMQNIIQMATQAAMQGGGIPVSTTGPASTSASSTASTSTTNASNNRSQPSGSTANPPAGGSTANPPAGGSTAPPPAGGTVPNMPGASGGAPPRGAAFVIPGPAGMMPGMFPPGMFPSPSDPFLACNSRHFLARRVRAAARQQQQQQQGQNATAANGAGNNANNMNAPGHPLAGVVSSLVGSLINQQTGAAAVPAGTAVPPGRATGGATRSSTTTTSSAQGPRPANPFSGLFGPGMTFIRGTIPPPRPTATVAPSSVPPPGGAPGGAPGEPPFIAAMRNLLQQGNQQRPPQAQSTSQPQPQQQTASTTSTSTSSSSTTAPPSGEITDEVFTQLVRGISSHVAQVAVGQQPPDTIADFLNNLGQNYNIPQGDGLLTDIFNCVAQSLTFTDFMAVFYGQPEPLQRLQTPLRTLVRERILKGAEPTETNITAATERLIDEMQPDLDSVCADAQGQDDINFQATLTTFIRSNLIRMITFIMESPDNSASFGQDLYQRTRDLIYEFVAVCRECLEGGDQALRTLVENRIRHISRDVNPMIQQWMVSISGQELSHIMPRAHICDEHLLDYVVRRGAAQTSPQSQSSDASYMSAQSEPVVNGVAHQGAAEEVPPCDAVETEAMDVDSPSPAEGATAFRGARPKVPQIAQSVLDSLPAPPRPETRDNMQAAIGTQTWHRMIPQDWVPVIARDQNRQRRQPQSQPPFSDAYLNGMPAKRRKVMQQKRPEDELSNLSDVIPEAVHRATAAAAAEPLSSMETVLREAADSPQLQQAFENQVVLAVRDRVQNDPDFVSEKYPNANKFFGKKK